jgi:NAD-dependent dihydropyrimidine dehydrogenase PreA subunit
LYPINFLLTTEIDLHNTIGYIEFYSKSFIDDDRHGGSMDIKEWNSEEVNIRVNIEKCVGHAGCVDVCPSSVYELKDNKTIPVNIQDCIQCCSCVASCPEHAIEHSACL